MFMNLLMAEKSDQRYDFSKETVQGFPAASGSGSNTRSNASDGNCNTVKSSFGDIFNNVNNRTSGIADRNDKSGVNLKTNDADTASKANSASKADNYSVRKNNAEDADNDVDGNKPQPKTFRQVYNENRMKAINSSAGKGNAPAADAADIQATGSDDDTAATNDNSAAVLNCLSQMLGLLPGQLKSLLEKAGVTPEELMSAQGSKDTAAKLSAVLNLDDGQSKALQSLLQMVLESVQAKTQAQGDVQVVIQNTGDISGQNLQDNTAASSNSKAASQLEAIVVKPDTQVNVSEFSALAAKLKMKLDELEDKLKSNPAGVLDEIASQLKSEDMPKGTDSEASSAVAQVGVDNAVKDTDKKDSNVSTVLEKTDKPSEDDKAAKDKTAAQPVDVTKAVNTAKVVETSNDGTVQPAAATTVQTQKLDSPLPVEKTETKTSVTPSDIMKQVVEKAKVILTGDKSEMVMDLKPDSLGKLSLKVVTEHGLVTARFVAESQQVKQVLETNMQLLKDSLEKQGLNVQGFSVSVRQDGQGGYGSKDGADGTDGRKQTRISFPGNKAFVTTAAPEETGRINQYGWSPSTINLTA